MNPKGTFSEVDPFDDEEEVEEEEEDEEEEEEATAVAEVFGHRTSRKCAKRDYKAFSRQGITNELALPGAYFRKVPCAVYNKRLQSAMHAPL